MPCRAVPGLALALSPANVKDPGGEMSAAYDQLDVDIILPPAVSAAPADPPRVRSERNVSAFEHPGRRWRDALRDRSGADPATGAGGTV